MSGNEESRPQGRRRDRVDEELPDGTTLRVYLFLLQQSKPVGPSEVREGAGLSTASLASYHLDKLMRARLVTKESAGYLAEKMALRGFFRARGHIVSTGLFAVGFFATTLVLQLLLPWETWIQPLLFSILVNIVALVYAVSKTLQSTVWLRRRLGY